MARKPRPPLLQPRDAKRAMLREMQREMPSHGTLSHYLVWMSQENPDGAAQIEADLVETFTTEAGLRVLKMLEKAVLLAALPDGAPEGALVAANARRNFVLEIRRLVANG